MKARIVALTCALALASPVPALAQAQDPAVAPPGNSAVDQYRESVPPTSPGGRRPTGAETKALKRQGEDGRRLAEVLERTTGVPSASDDGAGAGAGVPADSSGTGRGSGGDAGTSGARGNGGAAASTTDGPATSSTSDPAPVAVVTGGIGPVPIWLMAVLAVLLIVGVNVVRQRRAS